MMNSSATNNRNNRMNIDTDIYDMYRDNTSRIARMRLQSLFAIINSLI